MQCTTDLISFNYDEANAVYSKLASINNQALDIIKNLENASKSYEDKMKGHYRERYEYKTKEIFDEFKDTIATMKELNKRIKMTAIDFQREEAVISTSLKN